MIFIAKYLTDSNRRRLHSYSWTPLLGSTAKRQPLWTWNVVALQHRVQFIQTSHPLVTFEMPIQTMGDIITLTQKSM